MRLALCLVHDAQKTEETLQEFEQALARDRNAGLFFKSIHQPSGEIKWQDFDSDFQLYSRADAMRHREMLRASHDRVVASTYGDPLRRAVYSGLSVLLTAMGMGATVNGHLGSGILATAVLVSMWLQWTYEAEAGRAAMQRIEEEERREQESDM